jgi:hypothetical protein
MYVLILFNSTFYLVFIVATKLLHYRCPVDDKLISRFRGSWSESGVFETQVFAYMKTFRFTGSPALYIECDVRMCHGRCPVSTLKMLYHMQDTDVMCRIYIHGLLGSTCWHSNNCHISHSVLMISTK